MFNEKSATEILDFAKKQIKFKQHQNTTDILPTIYAQYAQSLLSTKDFHSSQIYSYTSLSFADLGDFLQEEKKEIVEENNYFLEKKLIVYGIIFLLGILVLI